MVTRERERERKITHNYHKPVPFLLDLAPLDAFCLSLRRGRTAGNHFTGKSFMIVILTPSSQSRGCCRAGCPLHLPQGRGQAPPPPTWISLISGGRPAPMLVPPSSALNTHTCADDRAPLPSMSQLSSDASETMKSSADGRYDQEITHLADITSADCCKPTQRTICYIANAIILQLNVFQSESTTTPRCVLLSGVAMVSELRLARRSGSPVLGRWRTAVGGAWARAGSLVPIH